MIFGNRGDFPAALDVVGHEMTHGSSSTRPILEKL
jgi:Zn-dependent metalloprotease